MYQSINLMHIVIIMVKVKNKININNQHIIIAKIIKMIIERKNFLEHFRQTKIIKINRHIKIYKNRQMFRNTLKQSIK